MKKLYIVRHREAVPSGTPGISENDRPLTPEGEKHMLKAALGLQRLGVTADRILTSPLPRALRTAQILAQVLKLEDRLEETYELHVHRSAESIRAYLSLIDDPATIIVGHNMALSELVALLVTGASHPMFCELKKGGTAAITLSPGGVNRLDWLATPKLLRRLGD